jgi:hypothetical protein
MEAATGLFGELKLAAGNTATLLARGMRHSTSDRLRINVV